MSLFPVPHPIMLSSEDSVIVKMKLTEGITELWWSASLFIYNQTQTNTQAHPLKPSLLFSPCRIHAMGSRSVTKIACTVFNVYTLKITVTNFISFISVHVAVLLSPQGFWKKDERTRKSEPQPRIFILTVHCDGKVDICMCTSVI